MNLGEVIMYTTDAKKAQTCWRCRKCHVLTPLGQDTCSNPSCRADLGIFGEHFTPGAQQEPVRKEKKVDSPQYDTKHQSTSNLWEESPNQKEPKKKTETEYKPDQKLSHSVKKALKKQQAEALLQEAAARRSLHNRGPVKTFFVSVLVILVSLIAGILAGGVMLMSFGYWGDHFYYDLGFGYNSYYLPHPLLWHQIIPGVLLIILSAVFARLAMKEKADRKLVYATIGFWAIPFVISCWRSFSHNGGDSYELLSVYLFFLFNLEPLLVGSTFAGVKGLKKASSILRWIGILMLIATGVMAVILSFDSFWGGIL